METEKQAPTAEAEKTDEDKPKDAGEPQSIKSEESSPKSQNSSSISASKPAKPSSGKMVFCRVNLLDGSTFETEIEKSKTGQVLFEAVCKHLSVEEREYFALSYIDSHVRFWLNNEKKISKQVKGGTWVFEFQVKFYPPEPSLLHDDFTRYQLCLQIRVDIYNGKLPCSFVTHALLGSYTVQAEMSDYNPNEFEKDYLKGFDFAPTNTPDLLEKIHELHKTHKGQTPEEAELHFLENAKKLAMYGVDLHKAKDSDNVEIMLGVCASGLMVYRDKLRINRFVWPKIIKLSYKRNNFYIKVRPSDMDEFENTIRFKLENHKMAKRLWKTCVEHHTFFRLKEAEPPKTGTLFPRFNSKFRYSGRTQKQLRDKNQLLDRPQKPFERTQYKNRTMPYDNKARSMDDVNYKDGYPDENDRRDHKGGVPTPLSTLGPPPYRKEEDGYNKHPQESFMDRPNQSHPLDTTEDRQDRSLADKEQTAETPGSHAGDTAGLQEGGLVAGKKGKKSKEDKEREKREKEEEKRRKKEEERKKKEEKDKKKHKPADLSTTEDRTDKVGDPNATETLEGVPLGSAELDSQKEETQVEKTFEVQNSVEITEENIREAERTEEKIEVPPFVQIEVGSTNKVQVVPQEQEVNQVDNQQEVEVVKRSSRPIIPDENIEDEVFVTESEQNVNSEMKNNIYPRPVSVGTSKVNSKSEDIVVEKEVHNNNETEISDHIEPVKDKDLELNVQYTNGENLAQNSTNESVENEVETQDLTQNPSDVIDESVNAQTNVLDRQILVEEKPSEELISPHKLNPVEIEVSRDIEISTEVNTKEELEKISKESNTSTSHSDSSEEINPSMDIKHTEIDITDSREKKGDNLYDSGDDKGGNPSDDGNKEGNPSTEKKHEEIEVIVGTKLQTNPEHDIEKEYKITNEEVLNPAAGNPPDNTVESEQKVEVNVGVVPEICVSEQDGNSNEQETEKVKEEENPKDKLKREKEEKGKQKQLKKEEEKRKKEEKKKEKERIKEEKKKEKERLKEEKRKENEKKKEEKRKEKERKEQEKKDKSKNKDKKKETVILESIEVEEGKEPELKKEENEKKQDSEQIDVTVSGNIDAQNEESITETVEKVTVEKTEELPDQKITQEVNENKQEVVISKQEVDDVRQEEQNQEENKNQQVHEVNILDTSKIRYIDESLNGSPETVNEEEIEAKDETQTEAVESEKQTAKGKNKEKKKKEKPKKEKTEKVKQKKEKTEKQKPKKKKSETSCFNFGKKGHKEDSDIEVEEVKAEDPEDLPIQPWPKESTEQEEEHQEVEVKEVQEVSPKQKGVGLGWALPGMQELQEKQAAKLKERKRSRSLSSSSKSSTSSSSSSSEGGERKAPLADASEALGVEAGLLGRGEGDGYSGAGDIPPEYYNSIDRKMQFIPVTPPSTETRDRLSSGVLEDDGFEPMNFFTSTGMENGSLGKKKPPPVPPKGSKPSEEDRHLFTDSHLPPTVATEGFKFEPGADEPPISTTNVPIVKTQTRTVTYEKDGIPVATEDSILISSSSHTTRTQTIETTKSKTERDGMVETIVEQKVYISEDGDDVDHDELLAAAIRSVTDMNPDLSVEKIEYMRQIEESDKK